MNRPRRVRAVTTIEVATVALLLAVVVSIAVPVALESQTAGEQGAGRVSLLQIEGGLHDLAADADFGGTGELDDTALASNVASALNRLGIDASTGTSQGPEDPSVSRVDPIDQHVTVAVSAADRECVVIRFIPPASRTPDQTAVTWGEFSLDSDAGLVCDGNPAAAGFDPDAIAGTQRTPTDLNP